jgi:hypothetical protein
LIKTGDVLITDHRKIGLKAPKTTLYKLVWEGNIPSQKSAGAGVSEKEPLTTGLQKSEY